MSGPAADSNWVKLELAEQTKIGTVAVYPRLDYNAYDAIHDAEVDTERIEGKNLNLFIAIMFF